MKTKIILLTILIIGFFIRIYNSNYPPLTWDEASLGYNAYSIYKTSKDEYGAKLPIIFKSFGDYKPGVYVYLDVPFVAIMGLNPLSTRLPSIILGSLLPLVAFFLIKELLPKKTRIPILVAILITFNPWNIHFSRGAWETNVLLFELTLGSYLFVKKKYLLSALIFGLSLYTYQSAKLLAFFTILSLVTITYHQLLKIKSKLIATFIVPLIFLSIPLLIGLFFNQNGNRLTVLSLFSYPRDPKQVTQIIGESSLFDYQIFHNPPLFFAHEFIIRYFNYFSPKFLFTDGDWQNPRHSAPYIGVLLYPTYLFFLLGLFSIPIVYKKANLFFFIWLILAPIASAATRDQIQAVRSLPMTLPIMYFAAVGLNYVFNIIAHHNLISKLAIVSLFGAYAFSFLYYLDLYYVHMVKRSPTDFLYGYQQTVNFIVNHPASQVYFSDFYGQPYIFYLYFSHYDPSHYQTQANLTSNSVDVGHVAQIDNIHFQGIDWQALSHKPNTLIIISLEEMRRQNLFTNPQYSKFIPLSPIGDISIYYAYLTP